MRTNPPRFVADLQFKVMSLPREIENIKEEIRACVEKIGAELVDLSFRKAGGRSVLTVIADKAGGITLDDCAAINRDLSSFLDESALDVGTLEVNSPGLDRPLVTEKDFQRVLGQRIRVVQRDESGRVVVRVGKVAAVTGGAVELEAQRDSNILNVPIASIVKAVCEITIE